MPCKAGGSGNYASACISCTLDIQTMKLFIAPEMNFKGHSVASAISSFIRSCRLSTIGQKSKLQIVSEKNC